MTKPTTTTVSTLLFFLQYSLFSICEYVCVWYVCVSLNWDNRERGRKREREVFQLGVILTFREYLTMLVTTWVGGEEVCPLVVRNQSCCV